MNEKKQNKKNNAGFYIALCCCVAIIGIAGYFSSKEEPPISSNEVASNASPKPFVATPAPSPQIQDPTPLPTLTPTVEEQLAAEVSEEISIEIEDDEPQADFENTDAEIIERGEDEDFYEGETVESVFINKDPSFTIPVEGTFGEKFSGDTLVYNSVMDDWRTHNGIDICAPVGTEVVASADGTICDIYTDYMGNTVVIDHENGFKTKYSNLDTTESLNTGMEIEQGEFLAKVGEFKMGENTSEPHIHFEIIKNDKFVDPEKYMG